jgi:uncharacterized glyoxalase superfamily protein PhnB
MPTTTSTTLSVFTLHREPAVAVAWLGQALGSEVVDRYGEQGAVLHAELRRGGAVVIVEQAAEDTGAAPVAELSTSRAPVLSLEDDAAVDALLDRAVAGGAQVPRSPATTAWGNPRFEVLDPEGDQWSVGSDRPGQSW